LVLRSISCWVPGHAPRLKPRIRFSCAALQSGIAWCFCFHFLPFNWIVGTINIGDSNNHRYVILIFFGLLSINCSLPACRCPDHIIAIKMRFHYFKVKPCYRFYSKPAIAFGFHFKDPPFWFICRIDLKAWIAQLLKWLCPGFHFRGVSFAVGKVFLQNETSLCIVFKKYLSSTQLF